MDDIVHWLYNKFLTESMTAQEILSIWKDDRKEWTKHKSDPSMTNTLYNSILDNYDKLILFLERYTI